MPAETCSTCRFWRPLNAYQNHGNCLNDRAIPLIPSGDYYCGEHQPRPQETGEE